MDAVGSQTAGFVQGLHPGGLAAVPGSPKDRVLRPAVCSTLKLEVDSKKVQSVLKKYNR